MSKGLVEKARRELEALGLADICDTCGVLEADCTFAMVVTAETDVAECAECGRKSVDGKPIAKHGRIVVLDEEGAALWT